MMYGRLVLLYKSNGKLLFSNTKKYQENLLFKFRKVNNETSGPIRLQYASGPSKELKINGVIADHVDAKLGKYSWKIPSGLKPKK